MPAAQSTRATVELLQERSREALIQRLAAAVEGLEHDELLNFVADLILTLGADRDQLKERLIRLVAARYGQGSEKSSAEQLQLFDRILRVVQEPVDDADTEEDESSAPVEEPGASPSEAAAAVIAQTNADIEAAKAERRRRQELGPIRGVLQGDGYRGFPRYADRHDVDLAGCMAHLRRKLRVAMNARDPRATEALALVQGLYRVEELARLRLLDADQRLALRRERSVPIMRALVAWAKVVQPTIVKGSPLGKAWTCFSNQHDRLQVFLTNGTVSIDNNAAERGLRRVTIGRKLWLFFRGQAKLEHVTRLMSVVVTARLHGVDELAYLQWVLEELARREWSPAAAARLLPDAWLATQQEEAQEIGAGND